MSNAASQESLEDTLDLDEILGLGDFHKERTSEEKFVANYTYGSNPRILGLYSFLKFQMGIIEHFAEDGAHLYKNTMRDGTLGRHLVTDAEAARHLIEFFLLSTSYYAFDTRRADKDKVCKMKPVLDAIMELPVIKKIILEKSLARY